MLDSSSPGRILAEVDEAPPELLEVARGLVGLATFDALELAVDEIAGGAS